MRTSRAFRPAVSGLEGRELLSSAGPRLGGRAGQYAPPPTPEPGNLAMTLPEWMSLHDEFVNRANQGGYNVVFLGDSVTYLWTDAGATPQTAEFRAKFLPARGMNAWDSQIAPLGAVNFGTPGDQTQNLLWRVDNGELAGSPKVAVVLIGINDLTQGKSPQETAAGVMAVVNAIRTQSPQTSVLLMGILPVPVGSNQHLTNEINATNAILARWSTSHRVTFDNVDAFMASYMDVNFHPTAAGYQVLGSVIGFDLGSMLGQGG